MQNLSDSNGPFVQKYVDILTNGGFKALFGDVNNKDVVMDVLNVILPENRRVVSIEYLPTEHQGPVVNRNKEFHYDFMCRDASGVVFIVELQKYYEDNWFKRCVSYAGRAYDRQNRRGENYGVPPVYLVGLMGIEIAHEDMSQWTDRYLSEYTFREKFTNELLDETIVIIFAELARFNKQASECSTPQDIMMYILKNIGNMPCQPEWLQRQEYDRIFAACEIAGFTEDKLIAYEKDMYDEKRLKGEQAAYRRMGLEEGLKEGRAEGHAEGLFEGRAEIVRQMYYNGLKKERIIELTGLPISDIDKMLA